VSWVRFPWTASRLSSKIQTEKDQKKPMTRVFGSLTIAAAALFLGLLKPAQAQVAGSGVILPESSIERQGDIGVRAHTTFVIHKPEGGLQPNSTSPSGETPASLGCIYHVVPPPLAAGCTIAGNTTNPPGGSGAIAVVDAYDYPNATSDLSTFSRQFGLPAANFFVVYATGTKPPVDSTGRWELEEALDIEWAHAMAPNARLYLVEAKSKSFNDLFNAESVASSLVSAAGGGEVTNSWQGSEFSTETADDAFFSTPGVVYFASSGDSGGIVGYPSTSPNVVSAGGTTVVRSSTGSFLGEKAWTSAGGGPSVYEAIPSYQNAISGIVGTKRGTPDFSFDADPNSGVSMYDSYPYSGVVYNWLVVGGTSVSSPSLAGIVNAAGHHYASSNLELTTIYSNLGTFAISSLARPASTRQGLAGTLLRASESIGRQGK
jgi:kumamolisin